MSALLVLPSGAGPGRPSSTAGADLALRIEACRRANVELLAFAAAARARIAEILDD